MFTLYILMVPAFLGAMARDQPAIILVDVSLAKRDLLVGGLLYYHKIGWSVRFHHIQFSLKIIIANYKELAFWVYQLKSIETYF